MNQRNNNQYSGFDHRASNIKRKRNRMIATMMILFFAVVGVYSIIRWAVPSYEKPIYVPDASPSASASVSPPTESPSSSDEPQKTPVPIQKTDSSFQSEHLNISIEKTEKEYDGKTVIYYVADIKTDDMSLFKTAFAGNEEQIPRNSYENPVEIANRNKAILAINCDNCGYLSDGIIVRNGALYRFNPTDRDVAMVYADGSLKVVSESTFSDQQQIVDEIKNGLLHTFSFGPTLIKDGVPTGDYSSSQIKTWNPRTAIGMVEPGHFKFVVVDGRTDLSRGLTLSYLEELMVSLGCKDAYNFDGGQSSIMIYDGSYINNIAGRENPRSVTDIIYLATPEEN